MEFTDLSSKQAKYLIHKLQTGSKHDKAALARNLSKVFDIDQAIRGLGLKPKSHRILQKYGKSGKLMPDQIYAQKKKLLQRKIEFHNAEFVIFQILESELVGQAKVLNMNGSCNEIRQQVTLIQKKNRPVLKKILEDVQQLKIQIGTEKKKMKRLVKQFTQKTDGRSAKGNSILRNLQDILKRGQNCADVKRAFKGYFKSMSATISAQRKFHTNELDLLKGEEKCNKEFKKLLDNGASKMDLWTQNSLCQSSKKKLKRWIQVNNAVKDKVTAEAKAKRQAFLEAIQNGYRGNTIG